MPDVAIVWPESFTGSDFGSPVTASISGSDSLLLGDIPGLGFPAANDTVALTESAAIPFIQGDGAFSFDQAIDGIGLSTTADTASLSEVATTVFSTNADVFTFADSAPLPDVVLDTVNDSIAAGDIAVGILLALADTASAVDAGASGTVLALAESLTFADSGATAASLTSSEVMIGQELGTPLMSFSPTEAVTFGDVALSAFLTSATDALSVADSVSSPSVSILLADVASGFVTPGVTEVGSIAAAVTATETATLVEAGGLVAASTGSDSATLADSAVPATATAGADMATLAEAGAADAVISGTDTSVLSEDEEPGPTSTDAGTLAEVAALILIGNETAVASDGGGGTVLAASTIGVDLGCFFDTQIVGSNGDHLLIGTEIDSFQIGQLP